jgi:molybdate transport system ATP-binding protein
LLLMDEPLANLDRQRKLDILPYLDRLHETLRIPIVYVSHDLDEVARLSDHLVLLQAGRVVQQGSLFDVLPSLETAMLDEQDASVVLQARIGERNSTWQLARLDFAGGSLWARDHGVPMGSQVRMRLLARDVSLSLDKMVHSSMLNSLPGLALGIVPARHPGLCLVQVQLGDALVLAQVTRRSAAELNIQPGMALWANIKSVALLEQPPGPG